MTHGLGKRGGLRISYPSTLGSSSVICTLGSFAKENWFDLLPDIDSVVAGTEWGLEGLRVVAPKEVKPSLKYVVRRIRNALGHGRVVVNVPGKGLTRENMLQTVTVTFHDENQRDPSDTFEAELSSDGITRLVRKFQSVVHKHVRDKYRI